MQTQLKQLPQLHSCEHCGSLPVTFPQHSSTRSANAVLWESAKMLQEHVLIFSIGLKKKHHMLPMSVHQQNASAHAARYGILALKPLLSKV